MFQNETLAIKISVNIVEYCIDAYNTPIIKLTCKKEGVVHAKTFLYQ